MAGLVGYDSSDEDEDIQEVPEAQVSRSYEFAERANADRQDISPLHRLKVKLPQRQNMARVSARRFHFLRAIFELTRPSQPHR